MSKKININDPSAWRDLDWDEPQAPELLKRTDSQVAVARSNRLKAQNPEWRKKQKEGANRKKQDIFYIEKQKQGSKKRSQDLSYIEKVKEGLKKIKNTPEYQKSRIQASEKHSKTMFTPDGIFPSFTEARKQLNLSIGSLQYRIKKYPDKYYYIDKDGNRLPPK